MVKVSDDFVFRNGKYAGKSVKEVLAINPQYISWAKENAPYLFKAYKQAATPPPPKPESDLSVIGNREFSDPPENGRPKSIVDQPYMDFFKEGPNKQIN